MSFLKEHAKKQKVVSMPPEVTVFEAAQTMTRHKIGSVVILDGGQLVGIFTERDLLNRVASQGLDPKRTALKQVMSTNVCTIDVSDTLENGFDKMQETRCRRLPISEDGIIIGMVTMRDMLEWLVRKMETENIQLKDYIRS